MPTWFFLSSHFLFVFGDDYVTCHMGADVIPGDDDEG